MLFDLEFLKLKIKIQDFQYLYINKQMKLFSFLLNFSMIQLLKVFILDFLKDLSSIQIIFLSLNLFYFIKLLKFYNIHLTLILWLILEPKLKKFNTYSVRL